MLLRTSKEGLGDVPDAERMAGQPAICLHTQSSGPLSAHHKRAPEGFRGSRFTSFYLLHVHLVPLAVGQGCAGPQPLRVQDLVNHMPRPRTVWKDSWKVPSLIICRTSGKKAAQRHQQLSGGEEKWWASNHTIGCLSQPIMRKVGYWHGKNDNV